MKYPTRACCYELEMEKVKVNNPIPQQTPGLFHPLAPEVNVLKTNASELRLANTSKVVMDVENATDELKGVENLPKPQDGYKRECD